MASEFEELKLSVNLTDVSTAAGFARLRQSITGINTDLTQLNEAAKRVDFKKAGEQADKVGTMIKGISKEVSNAVTRIQYVGPMLRGLQPQIEALVERAIPKWARVPIFIVAVAVAIAESVKALGDYLNKFAMATLELDSISREIGLSIGKLKMLQNAMAVTMGKDAALNSIRAFSLAMQDIRRGTDRLHDVIQAAGPTGRNMREFLNKIVGLEDAGKTATAIKAVRDEALEQQKQYKRMGYSDDESARMTNAFLAVFHQGQSLLQQPDSAFVEPTPEQEAVLREQAKKQEEFAIQWNRLSIQVGTALDAMKVELLPALTELADYLAAHPEWADEFVDYVHKTANMVREAHSALKLLGFVDREQEVFGQGESPAVGTPPAPKDSSFDWRAATRHLPFPLNAPSAIPAMRPYFFGGDGGGGDIGENTAELKRLNDNLYAMLNLQRDADGNVSIRGGGVASPMGNAGPSDSGSSSSSSPGSSSTPSSTSPSTAPGAPSTPPQTTAYPQPAPSVPLGGPTVSGVGEGAGHPPMAPEPGLNPTPMASQTGASNPSEVVYSGGSSGSSGGGVMPGRSDAATGVSSMTGDGATSGGSSNAVDAMTGESKPRYNQPGAPTGPLGLRDQRMNKYGADFANPATRDKFLSYVNAETGGQGPVAQQAFIESILNRGLARGETLDQVLNNRTYFPDRTRNVAAQGLKENERNAMSPLLETAMGGSNISNFATGNAQLDPKHPFGRAGMFGFGGTKGATFQVGSGGKGTEYFGTERADQAWVESQRELALLDRHTIDAAGGSQIAGNVSGSGDIKVKVERPSGPAVLDANASMFIQQPTNRQAQMTPATVGPAPVGPPVVGSN